MERRKADDDALAMDTDNGNGNNNGTDDGDGDGGMNEAEFSDDEENGTDATPKANDSSMCVRICLSLVSVSYARAFQSKSSLNLVANERLRSYPSGIRMAT